LKIDSFFFSGIVRGIDVEKRLFYIITPIVPDQLSSIVIIVPSKLELPVQTMMLNVTKSEYPYMTYISAEGIGCMARSTRSNLIRKRHHPPP
jgi:hypothetical protein